jgi:hypothetical protein
MSDISTIRTIIADPIRYDRSVSEGDGLSTEFQLPNSPVVANSQSVVVDGSVLVEGTHYIFDDDLGLIVFNTAPGEVSVTVTYKFSILSDSQIQALLDLNSGDVLLASAACLDAIAISEVLIQKKIKILDLQTDGPAVAAALHKMADRLRDQAAGVGESGMEIIEQINDASGWYEKVWKDIMREG